MNKTTQAQFLTEIKKKFRPMTSVVITSSTSVGPTVIYAPSVEVADTMP